MRWHFIEGAEGCRFAREQGYVAIIVDALRASATAAMLLDAGAKEILAVTEVDEALEMKRAYPDALLFGERGGIPPDGFDAGNSPRETAIARNRRVIFTTTTGAGRLVEAQGAAAVFMGSTVNATAVARSAIALGCDIVVIPAGLATDPGFDAQEDWVAAAVIGRTQGEISLGEGAAFFKGWSERILDEGVPALFNSAPHAEKLRRVNLEEDIGYCAQIDLTHAVPQSAEREGPGVWIRNAPWRT